MSSSHLPAPSLRRSPLEILVADDVMEIRMLLVEMLEPAGHRVHHAATGREALRCLQTRSIDLVLTDVLMPDGDGLEVIRAIARRPNAPRVVAMSGGGRFMSGDDCLRLARSLGAEDVLTKPFQRAQLFRVLESVSGAATLSGGSR